MDWSNLLSGAFGAIVGAWAAIFFQRRHDQKKALEQARFNVYMMLLDLWQRHFRITSAEVHGEQASDQVRLEFDRQRWRIADELRKADDLEEGEPLLRAMFSLAFKSEKDRADALDKVIKQLSERVNPRYGRVIREISEENQKLMATDFEKYRRRDDKVRGP